MWLLQRAVVFTMRHTTWLSAITLILLCTRIQADDCPTIGNIGQQTEGGANCFFPYFSNSVWNTGCSKGGPGLPPNDDFCPTTSTVVASTVDKCQPPEPADPIITASGVACAFPFVEQGVRYSTCTTVGRGKPWCRVTDGGWSWCTNLVDCEDQGGNCTVHIRYRDQCDPTRSFALGTPTCNAGQCDILASTGKIECKNYCFATGVPAPKNGRVGSAHGSGGGNGAVPKQMGPDTTAAPVETTTGPEVTAAPSMSTTRPTTGTTSSTTTGGASPPPSPSTAGPPVTTAANPTATATAATAVTTNTVSTTTESTPIITTTTEGTTRTPACISSPCLNGGTCVEDLQLGYVCACPSNFTGAICDKPLFCVMRPCQNHGICTELVAGFRCGCMGGFTGLTCERFQGVSDGMHYAVGVRFSQLYIPFNSIIGQQILGDLKPQIQQRIGGIQGVMGFVILGYGNDSSMVVYLTVDVRSDLCVQKKALVLNEVAKALTASPYTLLGQSVSALSPIVVYVNDGSNTPVKVNLVPGDVCSYYTGAKLCPSDCPQCVATDGLPSCECADGTSRSLCEEKGKKMNTMIIIIIIATIILLLLIIGAVLIYFKCRRQENKEPPYEYMEEPVCNDSNCGHGVRYATSYANSDMPLKHYI